MNTLSSTEFRKQFARLTAATVVTVNGHTIGQWIPFDAARHEAALADWERLTKLPDEIKGSFNSKPFTPVPKGK